MNVAAEFTAFSDTALDGLWLPAVDALIKVSLVLGLAGLATLVLGRASAAVRHLVWTHGADERARASCSFGRASALAVADRHADERRTAAGPDEAGADRAASRPPRADNRRRVLPRPLPRQCPRRPSLRSPKPASTPRISLTMALVLIWAAGVCAVVARLVVGLVAVQWMSRRTVRVVDAPWLPLAVDLAAELGITRRLTFLESARATMPMASGIFAPSVLMPEDANRWPLERLRIVLLHELAHVKRRDCLTHVIAQLACALHWFNPLAWVAARHIRTERERACDDLVLACGTRGPDYAEELLEIARAMRGGRYPALLAGATLAMAHRSQLEGRLIAILDPKVPRSGVSRLRTAIAAATVACALPPLAAMQPWTVTAAEAITEAPAAISLEPPAPAPAPPQAAPAPQPQPRPAASPRPGQRQGARVGDRTGRRGRRQRERDAGRRSERGAGRRAGRRSSRSPGRLAGCRPRRMAGRRAGSRPGRHSRCDACRAGCEARRRRSPDGRRR